MDQARAGFAGDVGAGRVRKERPLCGGKGWAEVSSSPGPGRTSSGLCLLGVAKLGAMSRDGPGLGRGPGRLGVLGRRGWQCPGGLLQLGSAASLPQ